MWGGGDDPNTTFFLLVSCTGARGTSCYLLCHSQTSLWGSCTPGPRFICPPPWPGSIPPCTISVLCWSSSSLALGPLFEVFSTLFLVPQWFLSSLHSRFALRQFCAWLFWAAYSGLVTCGLVLTPRSENTLLGCSIPICQGPRHPAGAWWMNECLWIPWCLSGGRGSGVGGCKLGC